MNDEEKYSWLAYWVGITFILACLAISLQGCGDPDIPGTPGPKPVIDIQCSERACTILVHYADTITTWHDGVFYWHDDIVPPGRRYTNRDQAPEVTLTVEACNEYGCVERTQVLLTFSQADDDPIGCDPDLPCPIEVA